MLTKHIYEPLNADWDKKIKECCDKPDPGLPPGSDCCYDDWILELKTVSKKYKEAEEEAKQKAAEFSYVSERRDQFKKWYDELTKADDLQKDICNQLEVFLMQVDKVGINTQFTVDAVEILFCMIRDYYLQLDILKEKYDELLNCIKCLNNPELTPGAGLMKCIEDYGVKLAAAQASGNDLIKMVMTALSLAEKIDLNIGPDYGLLTVVNEWRTTLNCGPVSSTTSTDTQSKKQYPPQSIQANKDETKDDTCNLAPVLLMPVSSDPYYTEIWNKYDKDKKDAEGLSATLLKLNKSKESLLACKQSLESAIKEVDPKTRCK
jgi:hypothetical protein